MIIVRADAFKKGESNGLPNMYVSCLNWVEYFGPDFLVPRVNSKTVFVPRIKASLASHIFFSHNCILELKMLYSGNMIMFLKIFKIVL